MSLRAPPDVDIVSILSHILQELCLRNDKDMSDLRYTNKFYSSKAPPITIHGYLGRIEKYAQCSRECFVLALIYIDRIIQANRTFVVNSYTIHRVIITAIMLAAKFFDDQYYNNSYYAKVGGVTCQEINSLEVEFLFMNNFTLFVPSETYNQYVEQLYTHAQAREYGEEDHEAEEAEKGDGSGTSGVSGADSQNANDSGNDSGSDKGNDLDDDVEDNSSNGNDMVSDNSGSGDDDVDDDDDGHNNDSNDDCHSNGDCDSNDDIVDGGDRIKRQKTPSEQQQNEQQHQQKQSYLTQQPHPHPQPSQSPSMPQQDQIHPLQQQPQQQQPQQQQPLPPVAVTHNLTPQPPQSHLPSSQPPRPASASQLTSRSNTATLHTIATQTMVAPTNPEAAYDQHPYASPNDQPSDHELPSSKMITEMSLSSEHEPGGLDDPVPY